jgi:hypothetical protein
MYSIGQQRYPCPVTNYLAVGPANPTYQSLTQKENTKKRTLKMV